MLNRHFYALSSVVVLVATISSALLVSVDLFAASIFPRNSFAVGRGPHDVAVRDLDGDGNLDLAVANTWSDDISVLFGQGDGRFGAEVRYPGGDGPLSIVAGDFNGDAVVDLAVSNVTSEDISILRGNGGGNLQVLVRFPASAPQRLTTGDFNRDGVQDLAANSFLGDDVLVFLGLGNGTFGSEAHYPAGDGASQVVVADLDEDGIDDLVVPARNANQVVILRGHGDGTFAGPLGFEAGGGPTAVAVDDYDNDGFRDVAVTNSFDSAIAVMLGNGDGTLQPPLMMDVGRSPSDLTSGDFDHDGDRDLAVVARQDESVSILLGYGNGTFLEYARLGVGEHPPALSQGDVDGDGNHDLVVANALQNNVTALLGQGDGTFVGEIRVPAGNSCNGVALGQFTSDGHTDLAIANFNSSSVSVFPGWGDGKFGAEARYDVGSRPRFVTSGDLNGDQLEDLIVPTGFEKIVLLTAEPDGSFTLQPELSLDDLVGPLLLRDFNADGTLDLVVIIDEVVSILLGNGDATFGLETDYRVGERPTSLASGDLDADGLMDLVVADWEHNEIWALWGNGDGTFHPAFLFRTEVRPISVGVGDFNQDNRQDLALTNHADEIAIFLGESNGQFTGPRGFPAGETPSNLHVVDLDGDAILDLVTLNGESDDISTLLGRGDGTFEPESRYDVGPDPRVVTLGDVNGDGRPDIAVANFSSDDASILLNQPDYDSDGVMNEDDNCRFDPNTDQLDQDSDGVGDTCDNCPGTPNPSQEDADEDGAGDACDADADDDGVPNESDNCYRVSNPAQTDGDQDGVGDLCDNCPSSVNAPQVDTDGDAIGDECDNCPAAPNNGQSDADDDGAGDVCDNCATIPNVDQSDTDSDGVGEACDNCTDVANGNQANADGDSLGDVCDPHPAIAFLVNPTAPEFAVAGLPANVAYRLESRDGTFLHTLEGVRMTLTVDGAAVFGTTASRGLLIEGGGTNSVLVEFVGGLVRLEVIDELQELVTLGGEDTASIGIEVRTDAFEDFETTDGGFLVEGDAVWQWGIPTSGPEAAFSGRRVWATHLFGTYPLSSSTSLSSRAFALPQDRAASVSFQSWFRTPSYGDWGYVELTQDGGATWVELERLGGVHAEYTLKTYELNALAGSNFVLRLRFTSNYYSTWDGWYIDDFSVIGLTETIDFLDPLGDADDDGSNNADELDAGTDPRDPDSDDDGVLDGVDNCPLIANTDQADDLHPDGVGDACDDPDQDGVFDREDNCPDTVNEDQANADADSLGDLCDPYPELALQAASTLPDYALIGEPVPVSYRLLDRYGVFLPGLTGIQTSLTVDGAATFGTTVSQGLLLEGGGTGMARVEFVEGMVGLEIGDNLPELVTLASRDTAKVGIEASADLIQEFELGDGGFTTDDDGVWSWGVPVFGPGVAFSGERVWATFIDSASPEYSYASLISNVFSLPEGSASVLSLRSWYESNFSNDAHLEISQDGGENWTHLESMTDSGGEYVLKAYDLSPFAGSDCRIGFRLAGYALWYIDDVNVSGVPDSIEFLDPLVDLDVDGFDNAEELEAGTDPRDPDTDDDLTPDGQDNCPLIANPDQADVIHPNGIGDACDDWDGDGVFDREDNCADLHNPDQSNLDGDRLGDLCDPYAAHALRVRPIGPPLAVIGLPYPATYRLEDADGNLMTDLEGVQAALTLSGSATFGFTAEQGLLLSGGGTAEVLVEFVEGLVLLRIHDAVLERVELGGDDPFGLGLEVFGDGNLFEDFEVNDGGFVPYSTLAESIWEWGEPTGYPDDAYSGERVWGTNLDGNYPPYGIGILVSPEFDLPLLSHPRLQYRGWFRVYSPDEGYVQVSNDNGLFWTTVAYGSTLGGWTAREVPLEDYVGSRIRVRYRLVGTAHITSNGWYIDDFTITEFIKLVTFLDPNDDLDGDGLSNAVEFEMGTSLDSADTDADEVLDPDDNCPVIANYGQGDEFHPNDIGDHCDDPDEDGVADIEDNCLDQSNPGQEDIDNDGLGDACDAFPEHDLVVRIETSSFGLIDEPLQVRYVLEGRDHTPMPHLTGVIVTLTVSTPAVFDSIATQGILLAGSGTNRVLVEFVDGVVTLDVRHADQSVVYLSGEDTEGVGIEVPRDRFDDFEMSRGGFTAVRNDINNDPAGETLSKLWQWGHPAVATVPAGGSGRLWGTNLAGDYPDRSDDSVVLPTFRIPEGASPILSLMSWFETYETWDRGTVVIRRDGEHWGTQLDALTESSNGWELKSYDLSQYAGSNIQIRFEMSSDTTQTALGWYIDAVHLENVAPALEFLDPDLDPDGDGLDNRQEVALGSNPYDDDTDDDGWLDPNDNCPAVANDDQADEVHPNGIGDACDDPDEDGVSDTYDNCPDTPNPGQEDWVNYNGIGDACDDPDSDGVFDIEDNCPTRGNSDQANSDEDPLGDACDVCPHVANPEQNEENSCIQVIADGGPCLETEIDVAIDGFMGEIQVFEVEGEKPESISFEILASSCQDPSTLTFILNGALLGSTLVDPDLNCSCTPGIQTVTFTDPALFESLWRIGDINDFGLELWSFFGGDSEVAWIRVRLTAPTREETACLYDIDGGDCMEEDRCVAGSTSGSIIQVIGVTDALADVTLSSVAPVVDSQLPERIDIESVHDGPVRLCVTSELPDDLFGISASSEMFRVSPETGIAELVSVVGVSASDIEHDTASGLAMVPIGGGSVSGKRVDPRTGRIYWDGPFAPNLGAAYEALEFAGRTQYGTASAEPGGPSSVMILTHERVWRSVLVGTTGVGPVSGLAWHEPSETMFGIEDGSAASRLLTLDMETGTATPVGPTGIQAGSLQFWTDGTLLAGGVNEDGGMLFRIDPDTGIASLVGPTGFDSVTGLTVVPSETLLDCVEFVKQGEHDLAINGAACGPPMAVAGEDTQRECSSVAGTPVVLDGSGSLDPNSSPGTNDDIVLFEWFEDYEQPGETFLGHGEVLQMTFALGVHEVTLRVTDDYGDSDTDSLVLTIVDTVAPVLSGLPGNVTAECDAVPWPPIAMVTDVCDELILPQFSEDVTPGDCVDGYTVIRRWVAMDDSGNLATHTQTITVVDTTPPSLGDLPHDTSVDCSAVPPALLDAGASDNCDPKIDSTFDERRSTGSCVDEYTLERTWTASDNCGNVTSHTQLIEVTDTVPPVFHDPLPDLVVECDAVPSAMLIARTTDNCAVQVDVVLNETESAGDCIGEYLLTRARSAVDHCGNTATRVQVLTVLDTAPPAIVAPPPLIVECAAPGGIPATDPILESWLGAATAVDSCSAVALSVNAPAFFPLGETVVDFIATDDCGNRQIATSVVTVVDTTPPVVFCSVESTNRDDEGDDGDLRIIEYSASDTCGLVDLFGQIHVQIGPGPGPGGTCGVVPVDRGQIVSIDCGEDDCQSEWRDDGGLVVLEIETGSAELSVLGRDAANNTGSCTVNLCPPGDDEFSDAAQSEVWQEDVASPWQSLAAGGDPRGSLSR